MIVLTPHLFQGDYWCLWNLRGIFGPFGTKALESFGVGSASVEGDLELSMMVCSASTLRLLRECRSAVEVCGVMRTTEGH